MSNSDWLTIPGEEVWETIKNRVYEATKETVSDIDIEEDAIESTLESMIDNGRIDGHIETMVESTIEYNYDLLDGDDVIDVIANQWRDGEYDEFVKDLQTEYSAIDMKEVEKLIDARHGEDTATSTELYEQVQDLTKKVDQMQKTISVIVSSMASVVAFVHQSE
tara:strand:- start:13 stop:504 length:492 start_codon:yes stop_codon:yes gene_type:complete